MNRRRHETRTPFSVFFALILAAAIAAAGGVLHAFYKNRQVQITREIDAIDRHVVQCRLDIQTTEMPMGVVEEIDLASSNRHSVASAAP